MLDMKQGNMEELLFEAKQFAAGFVVDTYLLNNTRTDGTGDLTAAATQEPVSASLQNPWRLEGVSL